MYFNVLFDRSAGTVRTTQRLEESSTWTTTAEAIGES